MKMTEYPTVQDNDEVRTSAEKVRATHHEWAVLLDAQRQPLRDRKSTRLNSSHPV